MLIERADSQLLVVDIQEKLAPAILDNAQIAANSARLLQAAELLGIPAFISEHYVRGLGPSVAPVLAAGGAAQRFEKIHFSCAREPGILNLLRQAGRRQIILTGSEAHVCVLQSALGLLAEGFSVYVVSDAASSRTQANRDAGFARLAQAGVHLVSTEMVLFEWLGRGDTDDFRRLLPLIK